MKTLGELMALADEYACEPNERILKTKRGDLIQWAVKVVSLGKP